LFALMGTVFSGPNKIAGMQAPTKIENPDKVGDVYLISFNQGCSRSENLELKRSHYALIVDVAGGSSDKFLKGFIYHLGANTESKESYVPLPQYSDDFECSRLLHYRCIGKISNPGQHEPALWGMVLWNKVYQEWYPQFIELSGQKNHDWTSRVNCQKFARFLVEKLGLSWPVDVQVIGDQAPEIVDLLLTFMCASARTGALSRRVRNGAEK